MGEPRAQLVDAARSLVGALLLGVPLLYTMETWWLAWRLPAWLLLTYSVGGLAVVSVVTDHVGYHKHSDEPLGVWVRLRDYAELFMVSAIAAVVVLLLLGIPQQGAFSRDIVRLMLVQVVPLGLGASLTNVALEGAEGRPPTSFAGESATFATGAAFFALPIAPTEEMELIAAHAGAWRLVALILASLLLTYVALYVLEFRGHESRNRLAGSRFLRIGSTAAGYAVALLVAAALLGAFGHFLDVGLYAALQQVVTLGFVASLGGAAARVVL